MQKHLKPARHLLLSGLTVAVLAACGGGSDKNSPPVFSQSVYNITGYEDTVIRGQVAATDSDGDTITYSVSNVASHGVMRINADGSFAYTPNKDYFGNDEVTVSASDGKASATARIIFEIINVNDAPVLVRTDVTSGANGVTIGQIIVTDADNDPITFSIVTGTQYGTLDLDAQTGAFTYTPYDLELLDDSFVVGFTDGIIEAPIEATIPLIPQFTTNADKLNYYYSSDFSHLKKAEAIVDSINDGVAINDLNTELAKGYLLSGFIDRANSLLETGIDSLDTQAKAYKKAAEIATTLNMPELALSFNQKAQILYSQYISEKGISNLTSGDNGELLGIVKAYLDAGEYSAAQLLTEYMLNNAQQIVQPIYTNNYGHILTAFNTYSGEMVEQYLENRTTSDKNSVLKALSDYAIIAEQTGYQETSGRRRYQLKAVHLTNLTRYYERIQEWNKAKEYLAKSISVYGDALYDATYNYPAMDYAENTVTASTSSRASLQPLAGLFETLYPGQTNIPVQLILSQVAATHNENMRAQREIARFRIYNRIVAGDNVATTISAIRTEFADNITLPQLYEAIARDTGDQISVASRLHSIGENTLALLVLDETLEIIKSQEYFDANSSPSYMTGNYGCYTVTKYYKTFGGNTAIPAETCQQVVDTYFSENAINQVTDNNRVIAYRDLISVYALTDSTDLKNAQNQAINTLESHIASFTEIDDRINRYMINIPDLASAKVFDQAQHFMEKGLTLIDQRLEDDTLTATQLKTIIDLLTNNIGNRYAAGETDTNRHYSNYLRSLRRAPLTDNYPARLASVYDELKKRVVAINTKAKTYAINDQQSFAASLVNLNLSADMITEAHAIVDDPVTAAAEKITFLKAIGTHHSLLDHFPGTDVANVDSDNDGKPNFFFLHKTEEEIAASGLVADDDSDGDGVPDTDDLFPLDPTKS